MDKKSAIMKPEKKEARPKQKMTEEKIEDVMANEEGQEGKEDKTEAIRRYCSEKEGRKEAKLASCFTEKLRNEARKK